jgi:hypothetical protein
MPSRSVVSLTVSRNLFASAGVTVPGDEDAEFPAQPAASEHATATSQPLFVMV